MVVLLNPETEYTSKYLSHSSALSNDCCPQHHNPHEESTCKLIQPICTQAKFEIKKAVVISGCTFGSYLLMLFAQTTKKNLPRTRSTSHDLQKTQKAQEQERSAIPHLSLSTTQCWLISLGKNKLPTSEDGCQAKQPGASGCRPHSGHLHPRALGDQTAHWSLH